VDLVGAGPVVLSSPRRARSTLVLPPGRDTLYLVYQLPRTTLLAEVWARPEEPIALALPAGRFLVQRREADRAAAAEVLLPWGGRHVLTDAGHRERTKASRVKLNDAVWGALLALLGATILWYVQDFPRIPGQNVGPALFPSVLAVALLVCGTILIATGLKARRLAAAAAPWAVAPEWLRSPRHVLAFAVLAASNLFYLLVVDRLGFLLTAFVYLAALMWVLRVRLGLVLPVALLMALVIHYAFYKLLRVPLPWGVLQGVAW
jgi:putative tricarboxylic transport membrane protein